MSIPPASCFLKQWDRWRLSRVNCDFSVCPSYPGAMIVPRLVDDNALVKAARFRQGGRFPVLCYCHQPNGMVRPTAMCFRYSCWLSYSLLYQVIICFFLTLLHTHTNTHMYTQVLVHRKQSISSAVSQLVYFHQYTSMQYAVHTMYLVVQCADLHRVVLSQI